MNERYYAAGIGRFLTKDAVLGDLNDTQSLNKYAYALGDPVNLKDDGGLYAMPANYSDADPNVQSYSVQRQNNFSKGAASTRKIAPNIQSSKNKVNTTKNIAITLVINIINSKTFRNEIKYADEIYKEIKGVSSGAPNFVKYGGGILQAWSAWNDFQSIPGEKSPFKLYMTSNSLVSNIEPYPFNYILSIGSGILKEVYNYWLPSTQKAADYSTVIISAPSVH